MEDFTNIHFTEMIIRTTIAFTAILILARIIGKKQVSQFTFFHYATGITFGSIAAEISSKADGAYWDGVTGLVWWSFLTLLVSFITLRSKKLRVLLDDKPMILIKNGVIMDNALKKSRLHVDELGMLLREQNIFSLDEVHYAIFETNGQLSVLKKPAHNSATRQDVKADVSIPPYVPTEIISNGKIISENLNEIGLTEEWVMNKLRKKKVQNLEDVYYAQVLENGSIYISLRNDSGKAI
ncbi:uncharacterized membrane protein YcaP [Ureibacillus xyleni]|uniref:Uncharacterized membrane protein YcaP n=1 Tax=Ureibacillus xyleni TaxID=614648 RepID=A0A285TLE2_9BACL|nr:DUF421 domain-containing protein [Ureibacillus xyleni]SOC23177.1 uncharacterized membrane protein YcaP [Ureibacillus xyleni]